ncbi:hypothetical protein ACHAQA_009658 [Verticillium albo-atrum]
METLDLVVVGAGWFGLAVAKTHHQLHPDSSLAVLELSSTIGGVWAEHRLYPGLKSNNMLGTYEYPDFPMDTETFGVKPGQFIPGPVVHRYLTKYAERFDILGRVRCEHKVISAEKQPGGGWLLTVQATKDVVESQILAKKLVLATGLTSEAFLPEFDGQETFGAPIFHVKDFAQNAYTLETASSVTVFGGTKSAWDMVYAHATKNVKVDWVIRETGHGPAWMAPPYVTPAKKWLEKLVHTRLLTWFSPCSWGNADGYSGIRRFLHGTFIGRAITNAFWWVLGNDVITLNKYDSHPEMKKLKPWSEPMFTASSFSIMNYDTDIFELVRNGTIRVHVADIIKLSAHKVHLSNGGELPTDALCCSTGWKHLPPIKFLPEGVESELGIPHTPDSKAFPQAELVAKADEEILRRWPRLKQQPIQNPKLAPLLANPGVSTTEALNPSTPLTPYTLHRFMIPTSASSFAHRDLALAGVLMNFSVSMVAHVQSLWIEAYFNDKLATLHNVDSDPKALKELRYETVLHSRFGKWRYPAGYGTKFPDFVFDAVPYLDLLLGELGLNIHRKAGRVAEVLEPYGPEDYKDLISEWTGKTIL